MAAPTEDFAPFPTIVPEKFCSSLLQKQAKPILHRVAPPSLLKTFAKAMFPSTYFAGKLSDSVIFVSLLVSYGRE